MKSKNSNKKDNCFSRKWICTECGKEAVYHECRSSKHIYYCQKCYSKKLGFMGKSLG